MGSDRWIAPRLTLHCTCGRRLARAFVHPEWGLLDLNIRPGHGERPAVGHGRRWQLRCPRHQPARTWPLTETYLDPLVRSAVAYGRRELVLGVDV